MVRNSNNLAVLLTAAVSLSTCWVGVAPASDPEGDADISIQIVGLAGNERDKADEALALTRQLLRHYGDNPDARLPLLWGYTTQDATVKALRGAVSKNGSSLLLRYRGSDDEVAMMAGWLLAATGCPDNDEAVRLFRAELISGNANASRVCLAVAAIVNSTSVETPVMGDVLRGIAALPLSERIKFWKRLSGVEAVRCTDFDGLQHLEKSDISALRAAHALGQVGVTEASILVEQGRLFADTPSVLAAIREGYPLDVRICAIRMLGYPRLGLQIGQIRDTVARYYLHDSSTAIRLAAAETLDALLDSRPPRTEVVSIVCGNEFPAEARDEVARMLEEAGQSHCRPVPYERCRQGRFQDVSDELWEDYLKHALAMGNSGQRRLAIARVRETTTETERSRSFRLGILKILQECEKTRERHSVVTEIETAIRQIEPMID